MDIQLNRNSQTPIYLQLKNSIRKKILSKELQTGFKFPSERQLAAQLSIHRNTVIKAYDALVQEGLMTSSRTAPRGYFAGETMEEIFSCKEVERHLFSPLEKAIKYEFLNAYNVFQDFYNSSYSKNCISFAGLAMNEETLPLSYIKSIMGEIIESDELDAFWYCDSQGMECLRRSIANMLFKRNIYVNQSNIQIASETFEIMNCITSMYLEKGDYVVSEEPVCPSTVNVFMNAGVTTIFVPMDEEGMSVVVLEQMIAKYKPKLIYTAPNFHNPTGICMSLKRRKELLKCAQKHNIPIVEEDSYNEFNYTEVMLPSLYSLDHTNSVIYIDSSALSFFPGARLAYLVAPDKVINTYKKIVNEDVLYLNSLTQYIWGKFFDCGYYETHKQFLADHYKQKCELMCTELATINDLTFTKPGGGLVIWCRLPEHVSERSLVNLAEKKGLLLMPGFVFFPYGNQGEGYLRISFFTASDSEIVEGVRILKEAIESCRLD